MITTPPSPRFRLGLTRRQWVGLRRNLYRYGLFLITTPTIGVLINTSLGELSGRRYDVGIWGLTWRLTVGFATILVIALATEYMVMVSRKKKIHYKEKA